LHRRNDLDLPHDVVAEFPSKRIEIEHAAPSKRAVEVLMADESCADERGIAEDVVWVGVGVDYEANWLFCHRTRFPRHPHLPPKKAKRVTHVSGTECHLCLGPLNTLSTQTLPILRFKPDPIFWNMASQIEEARTQEPRRLCPMFAGRAQEGGKQTDLARTW
jgi:hypothetical protein